jgi:hypothetical protein
VFNFDLIKPHIPAGAWPPGDAAENHTKFVETTVQESGVGIPDFSETRIGKMLADHRAQREKLDQL